MGSLCAMLYLLLVGAYGLFLACGAYVFSLLEQPYEGGVRRALSAARSRFLHQHACVPEADLEEFLAQVMEARRLGVSPLRNVSGGLQWNFVSSLFFASTTLTTTGFGHPVPISTAGKGFCLLYLTLGIPFSLCVLSITSQNLLILVHVMPIRYIRRRFGFSMNTVTRLHALVFISFIVALFMFIPACIFSLIEGNWTYLDSLYFCFISLTTIGFGDYVPGDQANQTLTALYKLFITGYLLIGVVSMILILETLKNIFKLNHMLKFFLLSNVNAEEDQESEPLCPPSSDISISPSKLEEKARRRIPHSPSQIESLYGSVNIHES